MEKERKKKKRAREIFNTEVSSGGSLSTNISWRERSGIVIIRGPT